MLSKYSQEDVEWRKDNQKKWGDYVMLDEIGGGGKEQSPVAIKSCGE